MLYKSEKIFIEYFSMLFSNDFYIFAQQKQ